MSAAALNAFHNIWLRKETDEDLTLVVNNHPLPRNARSEVRFRNQIPERVTDLDPLPPPSL